MKIIFACFSIAKYGGIILQLEARYKALKEMGHDVDIVILDYIKNNSKSNYERKLAKLESGKFQEEATLKSQNGGYIKSEITGYWYNAYYGWLLPPKTNRIAALTEEGLQDWYNKTSDVDLVMWSFVPTKTSASKGFNWWHKYFELGDTAQTLSIHDGYYDKRNSWTNLLKNKLLFFECVHIVSYQVSKVFEIPRLLNSNSRYIEGSHRDLATFEEREIDFFGAHIFKSMKRMEDWIAAIEYAPEFDHYVAGSGIELYYMQADEKQKKKYTVSKKTDPNCKEKDIGKNFWTRAEERGMNYMGMMENADVIEFLKSTKFAVDPSFSTHYAKYVNTHLNGFIIEAMINGAYPILRNYRDDVVEEDSVFKELKAIYIPRNATPKEFASYLKNAMEISPEQFQIDIEHNFKLAKKIYNPLINMSNVVDLVNNPKKITKLPVGKANYDLIMSSLEVMQNHFGYDELPDWMEI